jgi:catechol 2,3-dioxygenase-like lactoylglutathione lyase family enzyme
MREEQNMNILAFDHINLAIPEGEQAKARTFYEEVLGMTEIALPPQLVDRSLIWFQAGDVIIHLGVETPFQPARKAHPALVVDDLDDFLAKFRERGLEIDGNQPPLDGYRRAHVFDPFGNRIELMEKLS